MGEGRRAKIVNFVREKIKECATGFCEQVVTGNKIWFLGHVITMLVIEGMKLNPGRLSIRGRSINALRNQEKESKGTTFFGVP
jgi:hypothetical protein